jgi:trigger factor
MSGPKKKVVVEVPDETIKEAADEQYRELRRDAVLPGFRKGRAPRRLLEKRFGKETGEQIKVKLLAEASEAAIKDQKLDILGDPEIDYEHIELPETGPLKFEFQVEIRPQFDLPPLEGIPVTRPKLEVTESQIDREIEQLQRWAGVWTPREGGAVERDDQIIAGVRQNLELTDEEKAKQAAQVEGKTEGNEPAPTYLPEAETKLDNAEIYVRPNGFVGSVPVEKLDELLVGAAVGDRRPPPSRFPRRTSARSSRAARSTSRSRSRRSSISSPRRSTSISCSATRSKVWTSCGRRFATTCRRASNPRCATT